MNTFSMIKKTAIGLTAVASLQLATAQSTLSWEPQNDAMLSAMSKRGEDRSHVVVGYTNGDVYMSFKGDENEPSWSKLDDTGYPGSPELPNRMVTAAAINPCDGKSIFVGFAGRLRPNNLWRTGNGGQWFVDLEFPYPEIRSISISPVNCRTLYVVTESGVITSDDHGDTWSTDPADGDLQLELTEGEKISTVAINERHDGYMMVGTTKGRIYYSGDRFNPVINWTRADTSNYPGYPDLPNRTVNKIDISIAIPPAFIASYGNHHGESYDNNIWSGSMGPAGLTWSDIHVPNLPNNLILGTYFNPAINVKYTAFPYGAAYTEGYPVVWQTEKVALTLLHKDAGNGAYQDNHLKPHLQVVNEGQEDIALKDVTIKYWYTKDGVSQEVLNIDYATVGAENIHGTFEEVSKSNADQVLTLSFDAAAGTLAPGASTGDIMTNIHKIDWSNYNELNDYSYKINRVYSENAQITVYVNSVLVAGVEPQ